MTILVTGSAGHLGEALMITLRGQGRAVIGLDRRASAWTDQVCSISDAHTVRRAMRGVTAVIHCATLHKPHVATHSMQDFIETNVTGTLVLLEAARDAGISAFVFTSTTSSFGAALTPKADQPAAWITEDVAPIPKNIYGTSKVMAENLCELFHRLHGLPVLILRTARFFPEEDDDAQARARFTTANAQANELLFRRLDVADAVDAHLLAVDRAAGLGFGRYILSATSPFSEADRADLRRDAPAVIRRLYPQADALYSAQGWRMVDAIDRIYVNAAARRELGWRPGYDFAHVLTCLKDGRDFRSPLAIRVGAKGYHDQVFDQGPYPI